MNLSDPIVLLSLIIFLPALGGLLLCLVPWRLLYPSGADDMIKLTSLMVTVVVFVITAWMAIPGSSPHFELGTAEMQQVVSVRWIPSFDIYYMLGFDGISFPLVLLTSFLSVLAMGASWPITKNVKAYCVLFLLLETGMIGVFLALDFFLFYVFWEVMLLPMYFLIGVWGGPRREYAAIKFFLFTLGGSILMLVALLMLYFTGDLNNLSPEELKAAHVHEEQIDRLNHVVVTEDREVKIKPVHTFNILALSKLGQTDNSPFAYILLAGKSVGWWAFLLLFIGFVVKLPAVPVHTWLPDAHVEAPTPISMILAGVLLKMGGYGVLRICYPISPAAGYDLAWFVCGIGLLSMIYGAFAAMAQTDFKRLVAYSSVSHMGYVLLGIGVWSACAGTQYNPDYWSLGIAGAMFQMIGHGISSAGMFFLVGVVYDRVHHRDLDKFGGLFGRMPIYAGIAMIIFFAGMGLPGLCGFPGEVFVVLATWIYSKLLAILAATVVILTAGYILWTIQRVFLGPEYKGPHGDELRPITPREVAIAVPLVIMAIVLGVYPRALLKYTSSTTEAMAANLADWTHRNDVATQLAAKAAEQEKDRVIGEAPGERPMFRLPAVNRGGIVSDDPAELTEQQKLLLKELESRQPDPFEPPGDPGTPGDEVDKPADAPEEKVEEPADAAEEEAAEEDPEEGEATEDAAEEAKDAGETEEVEETVEIEATEETTEVTE